MEVREERQGEDGMTCQESVHYQSEETIIKKRWLQVIRLVVFQAVVHQIKDLRELCFVRYKDFVKLMLSLSR